MSEHVSTERMNESLDGLLSATETAPIERHLEACASCRNEYARLSETIKAVGSLPRAAMVPAGAWEGIAARIGGDVGQDAGGEVPVYRFPIAARGARRISLSVPQLAAAAVLVAVFSAGIVLAVVGDGGPGDSLAALAADAPGGAAARAVSLEDDRYAEVVDRLERVLEEGRSILAPATLVTIETSLVTLNTAIEEIESALDDDPNSDLLLRMLANHQRTKLGVLQRAAAAVQAQT